MYRKGEALLVHTTKAYGGRTSIVPVILNTGNQMGGEGPFHDLAALPQGKILYH